MEGKRWMAVFIVGMLLLLAVAFLSNPMRMRTGGVNTTTTIYQSVYPIRIISIQTGNLSVGSYLSFNVTFQNMGATPIYYIGGCGSSLSFSVSPQSDLRTLNTARCLCAEQLQVLEPGAIANVYAPTCAAGSIMIIAEPGNATANLTLTWWANQSLGGSSYTSLSKELQFH